jgi:Mg-chelatase subunit ChlD
MAAIINTLDRYTSVQYGANGHLEYGWSNDIQEKILQFSFQINRTSYDKIKTLSCVLSDILWNLKNTLENSKTTIYEKEIVRGYLCILYKMIGQTRDIIEGKGEYTLTYMMIYVWHSYFPALGLFAIKCLTSIGNSLHPYGSWKDIKYFCHYCQSQKDFDHSKNVLIEYAISILNNQISVDYANYISNSDDISLAAKWAPREKSKFGWLFNSLAVEYFQNIMETANTESSRSRALLKCKTEYRKILSSLNHKIDTLQIKQCRKTWAEIEFKNVPSIALLKQKKAFLNIKNNGEVKYPNDKDRVECAKRFSSFIQSTIHNNDEIKGKRISMADFTKQALDILYSKSYSKDEYDMLNSQWRDNAKQTTKLGKMITMVDTSGSMEGTPMNVAIALGIRISENSILGNRVMTFSNRPTWVNLDGCDDFISKVQRIRSADWGTNTNFYAALDLILNAIIENKMSAEDVQDMVLVILSDMQIDQGDNNDKKVLYEVMNSKYAAAGMRVHGVPYKPPHILFWNLASTTGFPCLSNQMNVSMMSGFSPALLTMFYEQGMTALQSCTPWSVLQKSLENERYKIMGNKLYELLG